MSPYVDGVFREPTNKDRADWALAALETYVRKTRFDPAEVITRKDIGEEEAVEGFREIAGDLLCDLMHLFKEFGVDFFDLLDGAAENFRAEVDEELADTEITAAGEISPEKVAEAGP